MAKPDPGDVTRLLQSWSGGDKGALGELVPYVYRELRGLAAAYIRRERRDHPPEPTAAVPDGFLRLVEQTQGPAARRAPFFAIAGNHDRPILINQPKHHRA